MNVSPAAHPDFEKQLSDIKTAVAFPGRVVAMPCEYQPAALVLEDGSGIMPVYCDRFGRLWSWWPDTKMLTMIFDPREARG